MNRTEFLKRLFEELRKLRGIYSFSEKEILFRPAVAWGLQSEYFYIRVSEEEIARLVIGFHDPDMSAHNWKDVRILSMEKMKVSLHQEWRAYSNKQIEWCFKEIVDQVARLRDRVSRGDTMDESLTCVYLLTKWIARRDDYFLRMFLRAKFHEEYMPLLIQIARLMGREEEVRTAIKSLAAASKLAQ